MTIPVNKVNGIGPKTAIYLKNKKVNTVEELISFGVDNLALAPGFSPGRAVTVINEAKNLLSEVAPTILAKSAIMKLQAEKSGKKKKKNKDKKSKKEKKDKKKKDKKNKKDKKKDKKKNK